MNRHIARGRENELQTLYAVGLVGWLTVSQIARWVWPGKATHAATNRAQETLKRLLSGGQLIRRQTMRGTYAYVLTHAGAARANDALGFELLRHGYDLSQLDLERQRLIIEYLLTRPEAIRLGPAGVRGAVRTGGLLDDTRLRYADALTQDEAKHWKPAMVVRSLHPALLTKARTLRAAAGYHIELLGQPELVRRFRLELDADQEHLGGSW